MCNKKWEDLPLARVQNVGTVHHYSDFSMLIIEEKKTTVAITALIH